MEDRSGRRSLVHTLRISARDMALIRMAASQDDTPTSTWSRRVLVQAAAATVGLTPTPGGAS